MTSRGQAVPDGRAALGAGEAALAPTCFIDSGSPAVAAFVRDRTAGAATPVERAVALFYAVRDEIEYKLLTRLALRRDELVASATLARGNGFCIEKAVLLVAACRTAGIPALLRFADVRNHLTTPELAARMQTDVFIWHGLAEMRLEDRWVKATPAFDRALCARHGVRPIEFDGRSDAIFHEFDLRENRHMEYVNQRGAFEDLPYDEIVASFRATYPQTYV
ncbi:MAG: transglutaminase-like domain-containing protein [Proteobacteria bacterium]|jgi:transglutaminase-like putative cysteine protease|nr:transglutaminase-like domain-containing protein [Pseudomonadota bacterium]